MQRDRIVEFGVDDDRPFEHVDIFLARMADEIAELAQRFGADAGEDRDHPLPPKLGAEIVIVVIGSGDPDGVVEPADAAARRDASRRGSDLGEQLGHPEFRASR